jgi:hypothetical protein
VWGCALTKILEDLFDSAITHLEVDNAAPIIYELDGALRPTSKKILPARGRTSDISLIGFGLPCHLECLIQ